MNKYGNFMLFYLLFGAGTREVEHVYVRLLKNGVPVSRFAKLRNVTMLRQLVLQKLPEKS